MHLNIEKYKGIMLSMAEGWFFALGAIMLFLLGYMEFSELTGWFVSVATYALFILTGYMIHVFWNLNRCGKFWFFYTLFIYITSYSGIYPLVQDYHDGTLSALSVIFSLTSVFNLVFVTMVLLGEDYLTRKFWKGVFVLEVILIPILYLDVSGTSLSVNFQEVFMVMFLYVVILLPFYIKLFYYSFKS